MNTNTDQPTVKKAGQEVRLAKKLHKCDFCGNLIRPGEKYTRLYEIVDGKGQTTKTHFVACNASQSI